jgi:hypothetical protein
VLWLFVDFHVGRQGQTLVDRADDSSPLQQKAQRVWATRFPGLEVPEKYKWSHYRCSRLVAILEPTADRASA